MTLLTTLVTGSRPLVRESAIADAIDPNIQTTVILEGLPDGTSALEALSTLPTIRLVRIAPGCFCCTGNLTMRVTLNRILRHPPARLFISLATSMHLEAIHAFLAQPPYDELLTLTKELAV